MTGNLAKLLMLVFIGLKWGWSVLRHGHAKEHLTAHFCPMSSMKTNRQTYKKKKKVTSQFPAFVIINNCLARANLDKQVNQLIAFWLINMQPTDVWSLVGGLHLRANVVDASHLSPYGILKCKKTYAIFRTQQIPTVKSYVQKCQYSSWNGFISIILHVLC